MESECRWASEYVETETTKVSDMQRAGGSYGNGCSENSCSFKGN